MGAGEIHYKIPWRATGSYPGHHSSQQKGGGIRFRNHVPLIDAPDPRRFDIRASLRDPFEQIRVRVYQQTSSIPVYVIADLSASMSFEGENSKIQVMAEFVACLSYSAWRTGDTFGFIGCADKHTAPLLLPATFNRASGMAFAEKLNQWRPQGKNSEGLLSAVEHLGPRRALVFLLSDFHLPPPFLQQLLATLACHDVVPVMLWDRQEYEALPGFGIVRVIDPETNRHRMFFMRPALKKRIQQQFSERQKKLVELFAQFGRLPIMLQDGFDADEVTHYFFA